MKFELGKYYKHTTGTMLHVIASAETTMFGDALIAEESGQIDFKAVGKDESHSVNYTEIDKKEWDEYHKKQDRRK